MPNSVHNVPPAPAKPAHYSSYNEFVQGFYPAKQAPPTVQIDTNKRVGAVTSFVAK